MSGVVYIVRRLLFIAFVLGIVVFGVWLVYRILIRPQFTISGPQGSTAIITSLTNGSSEQLTLNNGSQTATVDPGSYSITITAAGSGSVYYETVSLLQRVTHALSAPKPSLASLAGTHPAYNIVSMADGLVYLDTTSHTLEHMATNGTVTPIGSQGQAQEFYPLPDSNAIVLQQNQLFTLHDTTLSPLDTTGYPAVVTKLTIGANPMQESFVVVANQTLYYYSSISAEPENIVTLSKSVDRLAIGGHNVMAYSTQMPDAMEDIASAYSAYAIDPILINESTKAQHIFANGPIADASLSPDGKWATIMPRGSSKTNIYTVETGTRAYQIFNPAYALAWTSDSTFAYSVGQSLWLFDVNGKSGHIEGKIGQGSEITSLSYTAGQGYFTAAYDGPDQAYIYYIPSESKAP